MMNFKGLKKVSGETKSLKGYWSPEYLQLNVDTKTGEVWTDYHYSIGHNSWTEYHDENVVTVGNLTSPMTMREIKDRITGALLTLGAARSYS